MILGTSHTRMPALSGVSRQFRLRERTRAHPLAGSRGPKLLRRFERLRVTGMHASERGVFHPSIAGTVTVVVHDAVFPALSKPLYVNVYTRPVPDPDPLGAKLSASECSSGHEALNIAPFLGDARPGDLFRLP